MGRAAQQWFNVVLVPAVLLHCDRHREQATAHTGSSSTTPASTGSARSGNLRLAPSLSTTSLTPALELHQKGDQARARDYAMTLLSVDACSVEPHFQPQKGNIKLGAMVHIQGLSDKDVPTNPLLATLVDSEKRDYPADLAGCTPTLRAGRISGNQTARGFITFEVPKDATGLVMSYAPFIVGVGTEKLQFSLGR